MTRSKKEIQDAVALLTAMHVWVVNNNMSHLFSDALNTISAAIAEIHEEK
jgi:vacuolar-type H+-ATPase subunit B/Vma2